MLKRTMILGLAFCATGLTLPLEAHLRGATNPGLDR
jgi:hypothetical protein